MLLMVFDEYNDPLFTSLDKCIILNASHVNVKTLLVPVRLIVIVDITHISCVLEILRQTLRSICTSADSIIGREIVAIVHHDNLSLELMVDERTLWTGKV